jgi:hypothetical protein
VLCTISSPDDPWSADDREWFKANPSRAHRLRPAINGEWPDPGDPPAPGAWLAVLVRHVEPGFRVRWPRWFLEDDVEDADEPWVHALFNVAEREHRLGRPLTADEIAACHAEAEPMGGMQ